MEIVKLALAAFRDRHGKCPFVALPARRSNQSMNLPPELVELLRCPLTGSPLTRLADIAVAEFNRLIATGNLENRGGRTVTEGLEAAFVNADRSFVIPVRQGIVVMVEDELLPYLQRPDGSKSHSVARHESADG
jgi:uncharacterized protein